jgi:tRNA 2-thiouridine synthesizing protein D
VIYSLVVLSSPTGGLNSRNAAEFAHSAIERGHSIHRVFFLDEGVFAGSNTTVALHDQANPVERWVELAEKYAVDMVLCVTSALRRGVLDENESSRNDKPGPSAHPAFQISGLGQLVDAITESDRMITFGN